MVGGNRGLWALRVPLELGARVYPDVFSLAQAHNAFAEQERLVDGQLQERFEHTIIGFHGSGRGLEALPVREDEVGRVPRRATRSSHRPGRMTAIPTPEPRLAVLVGSECAVIDEMGWRRA